MSGAWWDPEEVRERAAAHAVEFHLRRLGIDPDDKAQSGRVFVALMSHPDRRLKKALDRWSKAREEDE